MLRLILPIALVSSGLAAAVGQSPPRTVLEPIPAARFRFDGPIGKRIDASVTGWLVRAPAANPGLLAMFELRDRQPTPNLVPWAGEFVGKYLISAVQTLRMSEDPRLRETVRAVVRRVIAGQAEDGYLGPFPKEVRLLAHWDLWGHYHVMLGLLTWHEETGDEAALAACRKAADLVCRTFLDTGRRALSAGSDEMNLAVIHALGRLHRKTGQARYLAMMREIEKDWQQAGDYFRTGLAGVEYHRTPRPRWESLHDLQGLVELYLITGDDRYRRSFLHHWHSIRRWDRHNNGAFSSGEQATGNPFQPGAIETCCTVAWMAIGLDALRLTGDPTIADELELSTYNGMLGALHPSGSWCTYNTPMDGAREASHHAIVFQARAGTPDLNCCSVNGPRGLGMLSEWAVMLSADGLVVNYYGPMRAECRLADGTAVTLTQDTRYPLDGKVRLRVSPAKPAEFTLRLRIPGWSRGGKQPVPPNTLAGKQPVPPNTLAGKQPVPPNTLADKQPVPPNTLGGKQPVPPNTLAGKQPVPPNTLADKQPVPPGYLELRRRWSEGDELALDFPMPLRCESGDLEMLGRTSIYRGPILLAYDQRLNPFDEARIPAIAPSDLAGAKVSFPEPNADDERVGRFAPWLLVDVAAGKQGTLRLCDFATAGSTGSRYVSWLPGRQLPPPAPVASTPADGSAVPAGHLVFTWRRPAAADGGRTHTLVVAESPDFAAPVLQAGAKPGHRLVVSPQESARLRPQVDYFWKLIARNEAGTTESLAPPKRFRIDPALPPLAAEELSEYGEGPSGVVVAAALAGDPKPTYGKLVRSQGFRPAPGLDGKPGGAIQLDGQTGMLVYALRAFPSADYTVSLWFSYDRKEERLGQVFSAWDHVMDDPLRLCVAGGKLFARVEAGTSYSTEGVAIDPGRWYHLAAVKSGPKIVLYLDGRPAGRLAVPAEVHSAARDFALGGNPHFTGVSEHLAYRVAKLAMYVRALSAEEVAQGHNEQRPK